MIPQMKTRTYWERWNSIAVAPAMFSLNPSVVNANIQVTSSVPRFPGPAGIAVARMTMVKARVMGKRATEDMEEKMKNAVRISNIHTTHEMSESWQKRGNVKFSRNMKSLSRSEICRFILNNTRKPPIKRNKTNEAYPMMV
jgi:hypothetical protein